VSLAITVGLALVMGLLLLVAGCGRKAAPDLSAPAPLQVACRMEECPAPEPPDWPAFDRAQHLCSPANVGTLLEREAVWRDYAARLRAALGCYQRQAKGAADGRD
jgi:hypothetical protein